MQDANERQSPIMRLNPATAEGFAIERALRDAKARNPKAVKALLDLEMSNWTGINF
ncbi:hypothetical protein PO124_31530 [Bacillus licheniformis]|nr:hypothetical protein [Bacillus licheniformis]